MNKRSKLYFEDRVAVLNVSFFGTEGVCVALILDTATIPHYRKFNVMQDYACLISLATSVKVLEEH
jgi:hypothetical protein